MYCIPISLLPRCAKGGAERLLSPTESRVKVSNHDQQGPIWTTDIETIEKCLPGDVGSREKALPDHLVEFRPYNYLIVKCARRFKQAREMTSVR